MHVGGESIEDLPTITGVACVAYEKALQADAGCIVVDDDIMVSKKCVSCLWDSDILV